MERTPAQRGEGGDPRLDHFTTDQLETSLGVLLCDLYRDQYRETIQAIVEEVAARERRPFETVLAEFLILPHR
jgi:hypothetical protein